MFTIHISFFSARAYTHTRTHTPHTHKQLCVKVRPCGTSRDIPGVRCPHLWPCPTYVQSRVVVNCSLHVRISVSSYMQCPGSRMFSAGLPGACTPPVHVPNARSSGGHQLGTGLAHQGQRRLQTDPKACLVPPTPSCRNDLSSFPSSSLVPSQKSP